MNILISSKFQPFINDFSQSLCTNSTRIDQLSTKDGERQQSPPSYKPVRTRKTSHLQRRSRGEGDQLWRELAGVTRNLVVMTGEGSEKLRDEGGWRRAGARRSSGAENWRCSYSSSAVSSDNSPGARGRAQRGCFWEAPGTKCMWQLKRTRGWGLILWRGRASVKQMKRRHLDSNLWSQVGVLPPPSKSSELPLERASGRVNCYTWSLKAGDVKWKGNSMEQSVKRVKSWGHLL